MFSNNGKNGLGVEYNENKLFIGKFKGGKKNGKGKEYANGIIKYEGEYRNGEKYFSTSFKWNEFEQKLIYVLLNDTRVVGNTFFAI